MTRLAWTVAFLLFDREAGRVRPAALTGLAAAVLTVASHVWLSGPWLQQAGFTAAHALATPSPPPIAPCSAKAPR